MSRFRSVISLASVAAGACLGGAAIAQPPDHPVITEAYTDPNGVSDAPVGRDPANAHQEYIEVYLPTAADLRAGLNKDALRLAFYEVEGDSSSSGNALVNYRIDLPTFDLDPSNGTTAGAVARPSSGVVVLGWVDYVGNPPTGLAGTPGTRVALINGGVVATSGYLFVAMNGGQFTGTTNFPVPPAISLIDMPSEASSGIIQNGSAAYLLVNRDDPGYVQLYDDGDPAHQPPVPNADPSLMSGTVLQTSALLDGFAANDDSLFDVLLQPQDFDRGVDLDLVLAVGGVFSRLIAQIPETTPTGPDAGLANGYLRRFPDVPKTTENATSLDDDPVQDALNAYRSIRNDGPFFPTPGRASLTTSAPELSIALPSAQIFEVLAGTTRSVGVKSGNVGGNFGINMAVSVGASSDPSVATFTAGAEASNVLGQSLGLPQISIAGAFAAADGATATALATVTATNSNGGDPPVVNGVLGTTVTARVVKPTTGIDENGQPLQATVFLAVQPVPASPTVLNELLDTSLGAYAGANLGAGVQDTRGLGALLTDPATNLNDGFLMQSLIRDFPDPGFFVNYPGPGLPGKLDLVQTIVQSAEVRSLATTYTDSIALDLSGVRAIRLNTPDTLTFGGTFSPSEVLYFADARGGVGEPAGTFTAVTTTRGFELAIYDTNARDDSSLETGATDDFGLVIEVAAVEANSPVVVGEYVFLSFSGGLQGADVDSVDVAPHDNVGTLIFLDLDNLHDVLGIRAIELAFVMDGNGTGELDVIDVFSLQPVAVPGCSIDANCDDGLFCNGVETCVAGACQAGTPVNCNDADNCTIDSCNNGTAACDHTPVQNCGVCVAVSAPQPDTILNAQGATVVSAKNRFLSFQGGEPGRFEAVRVIFADLPSPYDVWNGQTMFVGAPRAAGELPSKSLTDPVGPGDQTFNVATLQCTPYFAQWAPLGVVHVWHEGVVPSRLRTGGGAIAVPASYSLQFVDENCDPNLESNYSAPLQLQNAGWGDVTDLVDGQFVAPDQSVSVSDMIGMLQKFAGVPGAIIKARAELLGVTTSPSPIVDGKITITELIGVLGAFGGATYPFAPTGGSPCP